MQKEATPFSPCSKRLTDGSEILGVIVRGVRGYMKFGAMNTRNSSNLRFDQRA